MRVRKTAPQVVADKLAHQDAMFWQNNPTIERYVPQPNNSRNLKRCRGKQLILISIEALCIEHVGCSLAGCSHPVSAQNILQRLTRPLNTCRRNGPGRTDKCPTTVATSLFHSRS